MLADPTNREEAQQAFVRTYRHPSGEDSWRIVQQYTQLQELLAEKPDLGRHALADELHIPPGRVRSWRGQDKQPDAYRGLQTALDHGWFIQSWTSTTAVSLNGLAAWICASGSIGQDWVPRFVVNTETEADLVTGLLETIGLEAVKEDSGTSVRYRPRDEASVLGRVLHTWTGLRGYKSKPETQFPAYPLQSPDDISLAFAQIYVQHRGTVQAADSPWPYVQIAVDRSEAYLRDVAALLRSIIADESAFEATAWPVRIYEPALSELRQWPTLSCPSPA